MTGLQLNSDRINKALKNNDCFSKSFRHWLGKQKCVVVANSLLK